MDIISFYKGETTDYKGRSLSAILAMTDDELESCHDYIQILFPNREPSPVNPKAPVLTDEVVEEFKTNPTLQKLVKISLNRMIKFYDMDAENPWWCTKNNHNYLRCTRILNTLRELEMISELADFYNRLMTIVNNNEVIDNGLTLSYWEDAFEGQREYSINVMIDVNVKASRNVEVRAASLEEAERLAAEEVEENVGQFGLGSRHYVMDYKKINIISIDAKEE